ncbi:MAG: c-type cytochrome [Thiobacillus sp.]|nr:c-type cytochrome [Thiobacillus sp.]
MLHNESLSDRPPHSGTLKPNPAQQEIFMKMTPFVLAVSLAVLLGACGKQEPAAPEASAPPPAMPEAAAPAAEPVAVANDQGKKVYGNACSMCHAVGAAGAPKPGDLADWAPRIAQGMDVLYQHSIEGYTGAKGVMPPRGGFANLSDDEVKASVDYMVALSK